MKMYDELSTHSKLSISGHMLVLGWVVAMFSICREEVISNFLENMSCIVVAYELILGSMISILAYLIIYSCHGIWMNRKNTRWKWREIDPKKRVIPIVLNSISVVLISIVAEFLILAIAALMISACIYAEDTKRITVENFHFVLMTGFLLVADFTYGITAFIHNYRTMCRSDKDDGI